MNNSENQIEFIEFLNQKMGEKILQITGMPNGLIVLTNTGSLYELWEKGTGKSKWAYRPLRAYQEIES